MAGYGHRYLDSQSLVISQRARQVTGMDLRAVSAPEPAVAMPCPACGTSLMLDPWWVLIPIEGHAGMAHVHALCGLEYVRTQGHGPAIVHIARLTAALLERPEDIVATLDEAKLILTVEMTYGGHVLTDRVTVLPDYHGGRTFGWMSARPGTFPDPPDLIPAVSCLQPVDMAAAEVDRFMAVLAARADQ